MKTLNSWCAVAIGALGLLGASGCGIPAVDPSKVQRLEVITYDSKTFCPKDEKKLEVQVKLTDGTMRATYTSERDYQFDPSSVEWTVTPSVGRIASKGVRVAFQPNDDVSSLLASNVNVAAVLKGNRAAKTTLELVPDFGCAPTANLGGADGVDGGPGADAAPVEAWATLIDTPRRGHLAVVHLERASDGYATT
ncbi:MAG TPA: hypothetical protein VNO21_08650, partial [Polyangiaceae bacterium]|nr:hypothetical protein [Polyangiaceae bacterium]